MQQGLAIIRQVGVNDECEIGQIEPARRHVGCDQDAGAAITHGLQRQGAVGLGQLA